MKKSKNYYYVRFTPEVIAEARSVLEAIIRESNLENCGCYKPRLSLELTLDDERWYYDNQDEFFSDLRKYPKAGLYRLHYRSGFGMMIFIYDDYVLTVDVEAPSRPQIERVFEVYERKVDACRLPKINRRLPHVFIGHGRSSLWRDLKDHLHEQHGYEVETYETGARAGHSIRDVLEKMAERATFACLVLTAEDEQADGTLRARENVIHELGLFQGRLGFTRAVALLEEGANELSNIHGINQLRFHAGRIKETFGDVLATLRREFGGR